MPAVHNPASSVVTHQQLPFNEWDALMQIQSEFMQSYAFMSPKQIDWLEYLRAYHDGRMQKEKVKINLAFSNINGLQALEAMDQLRIKYVGQSYEDFPKCDNWNKLAKNAYQKMGMTLIDIEWGTNKYMYWVKVKLLDIDEDGESISEIFDTRLFFPDPSGCYHAERYRWMWFRKFMTKEDMKAMWFANIGQFSRLKGNDLLEWNPYLWFGQSLEMGTNLQMNLYAVYMHMTIIGWHKYIIYTNDAMNCIAKVVRCTDLIPALKKRTLGIKWELWPVELDFWRPQYGNPVGISVMDLVYDKQIALSQAVNLQMKRAIRISLWGHKFYDINMIRNRNDIAKMGVDPTIVGINLKQWQSLSNAVYEQPIAAQMPPDNFNLQDTLQYHTRLWTGMDANQLGVMNQWDQTATEVNNQQANSNVIQWFGTVLNIESEKLFRLKWYLMMKKSLKWVHKITVLNTLGEKALEFGKDDLMMGEIDDVVIKSALDEIAKGQKMLNDMQLMIPFVWSLWEYSQRKYYRDICELITWDKDKALEYVYYSSDELQAMIDVKLLNNGEKLGPVTDIMTEDHIAYIMRYQQAKDSAYKTLAIQNRMEALKEKEKAMKQQQINQAQNPWGQMAWLQSQMAGAMVNKATQQWQVAGQPTAAPQAA